MPLKNVSPGVAKLYDQDFLLWTEETGRLLRGGRLDELDIEHIAEEIEDMGKSQRRELESRLTVLLAHLLKLGVAARQTVEQLESYSGHELRRLFRDSPSLRKQLPKSMSDSYRDAVEEASIEAGLLAGTFPERCPFPSEQILDRDFLPE